jgi:proteic killer suppression protein
MMRSFRDKTTELVFDAKCPKGFPAQIFSVARRKLEAIAAAEQLSDLIRPPGNRLEALSGDRSGQHSVRINDQFRICFTWPNNAAENVEIVDYHRG